MSDKLTIPDQDDVLATNERLTVENARLNGELTAATELLEAASAQATSASQRADDLAARNATLETAAKVAGDELAKARTENAALTAKMADFNKAVAAEVTKLGLRPKAAEHKEPPADTDLTPTQRVLVAKGVGSIRELSTKLNS
jgi:chromosome segregation ATPase